MMRKWIAVLVLAGALLTNLHAQGAKPQPLAGTELLAPDMGLRLANLQIMGVDDTQPDTRFVYSFIHQGGGVQSVNGPLMSGGADAEDLLSVGTVKISAGNEVVAAANDWVAKEFKRTKANFYLNPLSNAHAHQQQPLAGPGQIWPYDTLRAVFKGLKKQDEDWKLALQPEKKEEAEPAYAPTYFENLLVVSLSGNLNQTVGTHTLKPREEWTKGLAPSPYKVDYVYNRSKEFEALFGENISFKLSSSPRSVGDPVSGNAAVFGGLKYKKDKTKDNSEYFEFRLIVMNKEGGAVANHYIESKEPLEIIGVYAMPGKLISPDVKEVNHAVFLTRGGGDKNVTGINKRLLRAFILDMKTGEIVLQQEMQMNQDVGSFVSYRPLPNGNLELTRIIPGNGDGVGLSMLEIGKDGFGPLTEFLAGTPQAASLQLEENGKTAQGIRVLSSYPATDGGKLELKQFIRYVTDPSTQKKSEVPVGFAIFKYNADGSLANFQGLGQNKAIQNMTFLPGGDFLSFIGFSKDEAGKDLVSFLKIDTVSLQASMYQLPADQRMVNDASFYLNQSDKQVYILAQPVAGSGLYFYSYAY
ncbi:MAG: hypothetical protein R2795_19705 [Saprospiraceae bacterium]